MKMNGLILNRLKRVSFIYYHFQPIFTYAIKGMVELHGMLAVRAVAQALEGAGFVGRVSAV